MKVSINSFIQHKDKSEQILEEIENFQSNPRFEFVSKLNEEYYQQQCVDIFSKFNSRRDFVQVGIGGSALGPEMLVSALRKDMKRRFHFFNNIDPDDTKELLDSIDLKNSLIYVVSKSGGTAETLASFAILANELVQSGVAEEDLKNYFVFASDPDNSQLRDLGDELGITTLAIPSNIGGRFSVLTPVGLLPALFAGIDIQALCKSGFEYGQSLKESSELKEVTSTFLNHLEQGYDQTVIMPYSSKMRDFAFWFVQLWAESLGKKKEDGTRIGITPIPSYGATDQHSQMQLFMEGPLNKVMILVHVKEFANNFELRNSFNHPKLQKLGKYTLKNLIDSEFYGTQKALSEQRVPHITFEIEKLNEVNLAKLIVFFEYLTAITGYCLNIDPFNQPGVEAGKIYSFEWLDNL
ncbi:MULTISPECIES: hypothetical protein [unclassified Halobacteriovorax]|uniref:hypothetical protein n=1 Tax=unclassified Halobacteriovorax TaxID=2639665 RepID=UPI00399BB182